MPNDEDVFASTSSAHDSGRNSAQGSAQDGAPRGTRHSTRHSHDTGLDIMHAAFDRHDGSGRIQVFGFGDRDGDPDGDRDNPRPYQFLEIADGGVRATYRIGQSRDENGTFAVSPDGSLLAIRHHRSIALHRLPGAAQVGMLRGMEGPSRLAFLDNRHLLALDAGALQLWDTRAASMTARAETTGNQDMAISPDRRHVVVGGGTGQPLAWHELPSLRLVCRFKAATTDANADRSPAEPTSAVAFAPSGRRLVTGDWQHRVLLLDVSTLLDAAGAADLVEVPATVLGEHERWVEVARFVDEHTVVTGGWDGAVLRWDIREPGRPRPLGRHAGHVIALDVHPHGRGVLSAGSDGVLTVWPLEDRGTIHSGSTGESSGDSSAVVDAFVVMAELLTDAASPADRAAAVAIGHEVATPWFADWLLRHRHRIIRGGLPTLLRDALAAPPLRGAAEAALAGPGAPRLLARPLRTGGWTDALVHQHETGLTVTHAAFAASGTILAFGSGRLADDGSFMFIEVADGMRAAGHPIGQVREDEGAFAVSPDGTLLALRQHRDIALHHLPNTASRGTLPGWEGPMRLTFLDDRHLLALDGCELRLWDARTATMLATADTVGSLDMAVSPDGRHVVVTGGSGMRRHAVHDLPSLRLRCLFTSPAVSAGSTSAVAFAPSGRWLATGDWANRVTLLDIAALPMGPGETAEPTRAGKPQEAEESQKTQEATVEVPAIVLGQHAKWVEAVRFVDEHTVVSVGWDGAVLLWDTREPGRPRWLGAHADRVTALDVHPDRRHVLTAAADGVVTVWDVGRAADGPPPRSDGEPTPPDITACVLTPQLRASWSEDHWDPATWCVRLTGDAAAVDNTGRTDEIVLDAAPLRVTVTGPDTFDVLDRSGRVTSWAIA